MCNAISRDSSQYAGKQLSSEVTVVLAVAIQVSANLRIGRGDYQYLTRYVVQNADALQLRLLSGDALTDEDFPVKYSYPGSLHGFLAVDLLGKFAHLTAGQRFVAVVAGSTQATRLGWLLLAG